MLGSGMNLITTIIGFGISATFIVFVCTRLICGRLRRLEAEQMLEIDPRIDFQLPENRINGLEAVVVAAIPTMKFNREAFSSMENTQCTICLSEYQEKEVLRIMPKCGHSFHLSCIDIWLRKQSTCPVCRLSLQDSHEAMPEHSQQWLIPAIAPGEDNRSHQMHHDSINSRELDPREVASRST